ncbi:glucan 1-3-beta-glucosidase [Apiospora saccharicola]
MQLTTMTTADRTLTISPGGPPTITVEKPLTGPSSSISQAPQIIIIGGSSITLESVTKETTLTTNGQTVTLVPGMLPTVTVNPLPSNPPATTTTTKDGEDIGPLVTFSTWPAVAVITPVAIEVDKPKKSDDDDESSVIPCKLWFFSLCIKFDDVNILGWKLTLPPGIYPPGPPPIPNIKFPPPIAIKGSLPPWPKFTVGNDHIPTFPSEPEPTKCDTQTANICSTTTSFVVSTVDGAQKTVSTQAGSSTCAEVKGCMITETDHEATATRTEACQTATVTDMTISCSGTGTASACSTQTAAPVTGCSESVTASTTTLSCKAAAPTAAGPSKRQAGVEGGKSACAEVKQWVVYPEDGMDKAQTDAISSNLKEILVDEHKIIVSDTKFAGVNFWIVTLEAGQEAEIKKIKNAVSVHPRCTQDCGDPTIESSWRYQTKYIEKEESTRTSPNDGIPQMASLSQSKNKKNYPKPPDNNQEFYFERTNSGQKYFFDESAGEDIPVYIVDSGANLEHPEFDDIRDKVEFIHVAREDDGGDSANDDSFLMEDQRCWHSCTGHGTAMLSLIAGSRLGVAKKVKPYVVRVPRRSLLGGGATAEDWLVGLSKVLELYEKPSEKTLAVLSMSWHYTEALYDRNPVKGEDTFFGFRNRLAALINLLIRNGVFVVTGSGNKPLDKLWDEVRKYRTTWHYIPNLMVVGALDPANGKRWWKSGVSLNDADGWFPEVYAPGSGVIAAEADKKQWPLPENINAPRPTPKPHELPAEFKYYKDSAGTSDAAAYTAGLAAYLLKLHQLGRLPKDASGRDPDMSPAGLKRYIINNAWSRFPVDVAGERPKRTLGIWNGSPHERVRTDGFCPWNPKAPAKLRRQDQDQDQDQTTSGEKELITGQCVPPQTELPTATGTTPATDSPMGTGASTTIDEVSATGRRRVDVAMHRGDQEGVLALPSSRGSGLQQRQEVYLHPAADDDDDNHQDAPDQQHAACAPPPPPATWTGTPPEPPLKSLEIAPEDDHCREPFDHPDSHGEEVRNFAEVCYREYPRKMDSQSERVVRTLRDHPGSEPVIMYIAVSWIRDCRTSVESQDPVYPLAGAPEGTKQKEIDCATATWGVWKMCK